MGISRMTTGVTPWYRPSRKTCAPGGFELTEMDPTGGGIPDSEGVKGGGADVGVGLAGTDWPLYCETRSLLLMARTGEQMIARITIIAMRTGQVFMLIESAFRGSRY